MILRAMLFDAQAARCFADALRVVGRHPEYAAGASFEAVAVLDRMVALGRRPGAYIKSMSNLYGSLFSEFKPIHIPTCTCLFLVVEDWFPGTFMEFNLD